MNDSVRYWSKPGKTNTASTVRAALKRARELDITHIVVASCSGFTVQEILRRTKKMKIVMITHHAGFSRPGICELRKKVAQDLTDQGVSIYTGTHFFGGIGRAVRMKFGGLEIDELVANTLRIFGQGVKVAIEIAVMALDAGLVPYDREIISIGGSGQGADTAIVCVPRHGKDFFSFEVREIICKPRRSQ
jgi:hypothetical protein